MCRTVHAVLQSLICAIQMLVRIFITSILMLENLIRMVMQTFYNFISFVLQMISLLPICLVFLVSSRLNCFMCGGGPCQNKSGGACDCFMSAVAIIIVFFILRATGLLDEIFFKLGYAKAKMIYTRFVPTPGDVTECSRNDSEFGMTELESTTYTVLSTLQDTLSDSDESDSESDSNSEDESDSDSDYLPPRLLRIRVETRNFTQKPLVHTQILLTFTFSKTQSSLHIIGDYIYNSSSTKVH